MRAAVVTSRRQTADVPLAAVVVSRYLGIIEASEQFVTMLEEPSPNPQAFGMTGMGRQEEFVETCHDTLAGLGERLGTELFSIVAQLDGGAEQVDERLNEGAHGLPGKFLAQLGKFAQQVDEATLLGP